MPEEPPWVFVVLCLHHFHSQPHLSVGRSLLPGADGRDGGVGHSGGQRHSGERGRVRLALLPLVSHEGWQRIELFLTLPAQEHVLVVCGEDKRGGLRLVQHSAFFMQKNAFLNTWFHDYRRYSKPCFPKTKCYVYSQIRDSLLVCFYHKYKNVCTHQWDADIFYT